ncbi:MAG: hypothetical protein MK212_02490 [Saprospiraceae bacterium]|nr:hypothetical protein [Saprospiraceae bacterium]
MYSTPWVVSQLKQYSLLFIFLLCFANPSQAQSPNEVTKEYINTPLKNSKINKEVWSKISKGVNYNNKPKPKPKPKPRPDPNLNTPDPVVLDTPDVDIPEVDFKPFAIAILIVLVVCIVGFIIFRIMSGGFGVKNEKVKRPEDYTLEDIEENLHDVDVEAFLKDALNRQDYKLAIRLYFLAILKELSIKGFITWKRDKTNGHFLSEMRRSKHPYYQSFRDITRIFEYAWYSEKDFEGNDFENVRPEFRNMLETVSK